ncbi:hypothetical protein DPMN_054783 [Dreissena polymorpha]|uniref:Uncharacterized protein n=1 Tax=Dreissena polymorpha TaxID=45954 RepID=A0A9D4CQ48_DREPO|nr:hypothetical protein DPMN_054783 [Dreissena polymorpha]
MHESRNNISVILQRRLTSAAGTGKLPRLDIMPEIEACVVDTCGGCPSAGRDFSLCVQINGQLV